MENENCFHFFSTSLSNDMKCQEVTYVELEENYDLSLKVLWNELKPHDNHNLGYWLACYYESTKYAAIK